MCVQDDDTILNVVCPGQRVLQEIAGDTTQCSGFQAQAEIDSCSGNTAIQAVAPDGRVVCQPDQLAAAVAQCSKTGNHFDVDRSVALQHKRLCVAMC